MFDGNTFLPTTGIPMRKMACMSNPLALAEPVPLTVPILKQKSLIPDMRWEMGDGRWAQPTPAACGLWPVACGLVSPAYGRRISDFIISHAAVGHRSAQSPQCRHR